MAVKTGNIFRSLYIKILTLIIYRFRITKTDKRLRKEQGLSVFADVDCRSIQSILNMRGVMLFNHLDTGAAIFSDLVYVRTFHKAKADIGMA